MGLSLRGSSAQRDIEAQVDEELSRLITQLTDEIACAAAGAGADPGRTGQPHGRIPGPDQPGAPSGGENLTLRTLAALSTALDAQFDVQLSSRKPATDAGSGHNPGDVHHSA